jgi:hypothetical protein
MTDSAGSIIARFQDAPCELQCAIRQFFPENEWDNASAIANLESGFNAFALNDTASQYGGCGAVIAERNGVKITSERSVGYFQINSCNFPNWEWQRLYNAWHNTGTAHMLWANQGWSAWYFSAHRLGLL